MAILKEVFDFVIALLGLISSFFTAPETPTISQTKIWFKPVD